MRNDFGSRPYKPRFPYKAGTKTEKNLVKVTKLEKMNL